MVNRPQRLAYGNSRGQWPPYDWWSPVNANQSPETISINPVFYWEWNPCILDRPRGGWHKGKGLTRPWDCSDHALVKLSCAGCIRRFQGCQSFASGQRGACHGSLVRRDEKWTKAPDFQARLKTCMLHSWGSKVWCQWPWKSESPVRIMQCSTCKSKFQWPRASLLKLQDLRQCMRALKTSRAEKLALKLEASGAHHSQRRMLMISLACLSHGCVPNQEKYLLIGSQSWFPASVSLAKDVFWGTTVPQC